ncbi:MAG: hypothetical protein C0492_00585 [Verminephrobacter sp.]|nr:hypothetical protein [Verminephrobacter sp.]
MPVIGLPSMTYEELHELVWLFIVLGIFSGMVGGLIWTFIEMAGDSVLAYLAARIRRSRGLSGSGGMGEPPMYGLSRPTYPTARGAESPGRGSDHDPLMSVIPCPVGRVIGRSDDPRPLQVDQACLDSCLKDRRPAGAPAHRSAHAGFAGSGETPSVLEELAKPAPPTL